MIPRTFTRIFVGLLAVTLITQNAALALRPESDRAGLKQSLQSATGLEETTRVAQKIREWGLVNDLSGSDDQDLVRQFVETLRRPLGEARQLTTAPLSVDPYVAGPFTRAELDGQYFDRSIPFPVPADEEYLLDDWLPSALKVFEAMAQQLKIEDVELLGWSEFRTFLIDLWNARDDRGRLLIGDFGEVEFYRWIYRDLPRILVPHLAEESLDRLLLAQALENPFTISNDAGNQAMVDALPALIRARSEQVSDPAVAIRFWVRLALAANLVDYSHPHIFEHAQGGLAQFVIEQMETPFAFGGNEHVDYFVDRAAQPNTHMVYLADNNVEVVADLMLAQVLLAANPDLRITFIAKTDNGAMNDASVKDVEGVLLQVAADGTDVFASLRQWKSEGRFILTPGPASHGTPLHLLPQEMVAALKAADFVLSKGEANLFSLSGLAKETFFGLRLKWIHVHTLIFGLRFDADIVANRPPAFFRMDGSRPYFQNVLNMTNGLPRSTIQGGLEEQWHQERVTQQAA